MTDLRQAAQMALKALKGADAIDTDMQDAIYTLYEALEQQAEPVATMKMLHTYGTAPPQQQAQPVGTLETAIASEPTALIHKWRVLELIKYYAPQQQAEPISTHRITSWGHCGVCRHDRIPGEGCARQECPDSPQQQAEPDRWVIEKVGDKLMLNGKEIDPGIIELRLDGLTYRSSEKMEVKQQAEPSRWHYTNKAGVSVLHCEPSARLDADMEAAKDYPDAHKVTPLYTAPLQQRAEPVGEVTAAVDGAFKCEFSMHLPVGTKLYTTPPQRKELSASEILNMMPSTIPAEYDGELMEFARAVEAKTKEGA